MPGGARCHLFRLIFGGIVESGKSQNDFIPEQKRAEVKNHERMGAAKSDSLSPSLAGNFFTDFSIFALSDPFPAWSEG